jgi:hypothetical protein
MNFSFIITGFLNLLFAPYYYPEMFWVVFPLIITLFVIEFYSGLYENEDYGGHTALTNSLVFVYIGVDLIRKLLHEPGTSNYGIKLGVSITLVMFGLILIYDNFKHKGGIFSKIFSSLLLVNTLTYLAIVTVYAEYVIDWLYLMNAIIFILVVWLFFAVIHLFQKKKVKTSINNAV